jgi:hypothetical protein
MKRRREAGPEAAAGAEEAEEEGGVGDEKKTTTEEEEEEMEIAILHFSHPPRPTHHDGRGGFRAGGAPLPPPPPPDTDDDDDDGEGDVSAYIEYAIRDANGQPDPRSLQSPVLCNDTGAPLLPPPPPRSCKVYMALVHTYTPPSQRGRGGGVHA